MLLIGCSEKGLPLDGYIDEDLSVDWEKEGIDEEIFNQAMEWEEQAYYAFDQDEPLESDWVIYRDLYVEINNYFVERNTTVGSDEYHILLVASDMWRNADALVKSTDPVETRELAIKIEELISDQMTFLANVEIVN